MTKHAPGSWFLAPATDRSDEHAAGYDGNTFASREAAEAEIPALTDAIGGEWVAAQRAPASVEITRYSQDGITYICAGDRSTDDDTARAAAEGALRDGETLADDMDRVDGCCTWTVEVRS